jgi:hypothetical protein
MVVADLAVMGANALVQAMVTDGWEGVRRNVAKLFGGGTPDAKIEERLDASLAELTAASAADVAKVQADLEQKWANRLAVLLDENPGAEPELAALVQEMQAILPVAADHSAEAGRDNIAPAARYGVWPRTVIHGDVVRAEQQSATAEPAEPADQVPRPSPMVIRSPRDAEEAAARWCRWLGFADAELTGVGADGGVDVRARSLVAQVKAHMVPIGRPDLQKLYGVAAAERAVAVFFSLTAYTREAQEWADQVGMALFRFNHAGEAEPVNGYATAMVDRAELQERRPAAPAEPAEPAEPPKPRWSLPIGCTDQMAYERLRPRRSGLRPIDQLRWVRQGFLPFASLRYDFSYVAQSGRRYAQQFAQARVAIELATRQMIFIPQSNGDMILIPPEQNIIEPQWTSASLAAEVNKLWDDPFEAGRPAASRRTWSKLSQYGVPGGSTTLRVIDEGTFLLPYFAALVSGQAGNWFAVLEAVTGQVHPALSSVFTQHAPHLLDTFYADRPVEPSWPPNVR